MTSIQIIAITDRAGTLVEPEWLAKSEAVHRQLRPKLPADYAGKLAKVFAEGGRMTIATRDGVVEGVAVHRIYDNTCDGVHLYVDDLITDETKRSSGVGKALLDYLQQVARDESCENFTLDSGTWRQQAHKFYFREGMLISGFHFTKPVPRA